MLKKIAKRIHKEIIQANDYMEQAFIIKDKNISLANMFAMLSEEELVHAEKLMREGKKVVESHNIHSYNKKNETEHTDDSDWQKKCEAVWEWECHFANEAISECRYKLSKFKGV